MKLLIDIGNQRIKWRSSCGTAHGNAPTAAGSAWQAQWRALPPPTSVWLACVAGESIQAAVGEFCARQWGCAVHAIRAKPAQSGVRNAYTPPADLGADRWAALVAARRLYPNTAVSVVDVGTAVTVDGLDADGTFRGGVILPGIASMQTALHQQTADLPPPRPEDWATDPRPRPPLAYNPTPTATQAALASGALAAVVGGIQFAVTQQRRALAGENGGAEVLLTGGDGRRIAALLDIPHHFHADLVLHGLEIIAADSA